MDEDWKQSAKEQERQRIFFFLTDQDKKRLYSTALVGFSSRMWIMFGNKST